MLPIPKGIKIEVANAAAKKIETRLPSGWRPEASASTVSYANI